MNDDDRHAAPRQRLAILIEQNRTLPLGRYLRGLARASAMASVLDSLLTERQRQSVARARRQAIAELRLEMTVAPNVQVAPLAGLPSPELALQWIDLMERDVWPTRGARFEA